MKKIGFVIPWFGMNIPGGAEAECREVVLHLKDAGVPVEVLTTCVKEFTSSWEKNYYKPGVYSENDITIRRFKVDKRDVKKFDEVNIKLMNGQIPISTDEETIFVNEIINSSDLYEYMKKHDDDYALFVFIPYMFGTTYFGCQINPRKSVLIPCFHNESYFYMERFKDAFSKVAGIIYNALPEKNLVSQNYQLSSDTKEFVMGIGMNTDQQGESKRFRNKYGIEDPFLLYAGRKDVGKNVDTLLQYFSEYKIRNINNLKLVLIGGGKITIPENVKNDVYDLGFVDIQDKYDAYAATELLCQPSHNESFSLVIMESWLACRPVLVSNACAVTKNFAIESNAGLWFEEYFDFEGCVNYIINHPEDANEMGSNGRKYVLQHFSWDVIINNYKRFFKEVISANAQN